jgi:hypothetical protein
MQIAIQTGGPSLQKLTRKATKINLYRYKFKTQICLLVIFLFKAEVIFSAKACMIEDETMFESIIPYIQQ